MKLKIALMLGWANDGSLPNVVGDHIVALAWQKWLMRRDDVEFVDIYTPNSPTIRQPDVAIHFHHWLPTVPNAKNLYYCQNAFPRQAEWPNGTVGVFHDVKHRYDGYLFASERLREACLADGAVLPFATDPEVFFPQPNPKFAHPICFVGNDIRGAEANEKYLIPALAHGLVIYGGPWIDPRLQAVNRGRISAADLPALYSTAQINLNFHIPIAAELGMLNMRIYESLACGGLVVSDWHDGMQETVGKVFFIQEPICHLLDAWKELPPRFVDCDWNGRQWVLAGHTWAHRTATLMDYLKGVL